MRNNVRFHDSAAEVDQILERERISLHERMSFIVRQIAGRARVFFYELFPPELPTLERVTGFLAVLELVFQRKIKVKQKSSFAPILIERETARSRGGRETA
jgi:chromatin segregation and condensation protein Rec8/ScpA/Scc1 (kleisin family)